MKEHHITYGPAMEMCLLFLCVIFGVKGYTITNQIQLHEDIFNRKYDKVFRPGENRAIPTEISIFFYMKSLKEFIESDGKIGIVGTLGLEWVDYRLVWEPTNYGGDLNRTTVFVYDIWTPYIVLMNPYDKIKPVLLQELSCKAWETGYIQCLPPNIFDASCDADVTFYPFDSQTCTLQLYAPGFFSSEIKFRPVLSNFNMDAYEENGLWSVESTRVYVKTQHVENINFEILQLEIKIRRRSTYYIVILLPIFLINFMHILVFALPSDSGERVGFSITVLLTEVLFLTMIQEKLPEASEPGLSYLIYKLLVDLLLSYLIMLVVVVSSILYNKADAEEPEECMKTESKFIKLLCKRKQEKGDKHFWKDAGKAIDKFCLISFLILLALNNIICFVAVLAEVRF